MIKLDLHFGDARSGVPVGIKPKKAALVMLVA